MSLLSGIIILLLLFILTLSSYIARLYAETGKFLPGEFQENIDVWEAKIEPRLGLSRDRISLSAAVLSQFSLASLALYFGVLLFAENGGVRPSPAEVAQAVLGAVLVIVLFNQFLPFVFFTRLLSSGCSSTSFSRSPCCWPSCFRSQPWRNPGQVTSRRMPAKLR
jgi:putative hemolysin